jgi:hypothetical protein
MSLSERVADSIVEIIRDEQPAPGRGAGVVPDWPSGAHPRGAGSGERQQAAREHAHILAAIRDGDPKAAEPLTRTHLETIRKAIETARFQTP